MDRNKESCKEPSFVFKTIIVIFLIFLTFPLIDSFKSDSDKSLTGFTENSGNLFLTSSFVPQELLEINTFQGNTIYASSPLYFPKEIQILGVQAEEDKNSKCRKEIISHKVESGESLSVIASKFEISVNTVIWANNLKNNTINPGQDLVILPVSGVFHVTQQGENTSFIASKYGIEKEEIIYCNDLEEGKVRAGDILIIPGGEILKKAPVSQKQYPSAPKTTDSGSWLMPPTSGYISQGLHWHNAIDIANNCGTPIYASASGVVQKTGYHNVAGNYVRIEHSNGIVTFYGHLSGISVSSGQNVNQGQMIGSMGNTGYTIGPTGCHVHFEVRGGVNPFGRYPLNHRF